MPPTRLAILTTHPIQYNAPAFRELASRPGLATKVFYGWRGPAETIDREFGRRIEWDIPLLEGYEHDFLENSSRSPGSHHFRGIVCRDAPSQILRWKPDAVLVYGWAFSSHLRVMRQLKGVVPILFRGDSTLAGDRSGPRRAARRIALRWVYSHVDVALAAGTRSREYFLAYGVPPERTVLAPHAVDNERFAENAHVREHEAREWRRRVGIPNSATAVVFAGKFSAVKNPGVLAEAMRDIAGRRTDVHLILAGAGELRRNLEDTTDGIPNIHFIGFQNQSAMPTVYRLGQVTILPSWSETWGLAVNESMACGRPVIVSDGVGCAVDLVDEGVTGFVFPAGSASGLAAAIERIAADRALAPSMGANASRKIEAWSVREYADAVEQGLMLVCDHRKST